MENKEIIQELIIETVKSILKLETDSRRFNKEVKPVLSRKKILTKLIGDIEKLIRDNDLKLKAHSFYPLFNGMSGEYYIYYERDRELKEEFVFLAGELDLENREILRRYNLTHK